MQVLGIDIGGSGIKAAVVAVDKGILVSERFRVPTPKPATPNNLAKAIIEMCNHFDWKGVVACGFPTPFYQGKCLTGGNLHTEWKGVDVAALFKEATGNEFTVVNDADAAGLAELYFGAARGVKGTVIMVTLGTGIGSALFLDGKLLPNTELGHLYTDKGILFEKYTSDFIRKKENLSRKKWGKRLHTYFQHLEMLFAPSLIIIGGGASKKIHKFIDQIQVSVPIVAAKAQNDAGIIGAALAVKK